ncbi:MAG: hypothetical protein VX112_06040 [Pseudomonadota bacterium]|nr:hypothetical protein [Pseudomonadota bacterium]
MSNFHFYFVAFLTLAGLLPLQIVVFGNQIFFLAGQFFAFSYISIILAFLSGVHWAFGLMLRKWFLHLTSIVLSLVPWAAYFAQKLNYIHELETVWTIILLDTVLLLFIDYFYLYNHYEPRYLKLRGITTGLLMASIIIIIARHVDITKFS